ncbi:PREDICTED: uncharacterized protein LOC106297807 [Brassica oleracea var. oleracea]|nr:PREDICTED: uncharacterized protein LOC106297807 [Brassica oleracea var. oleracea]
MGEAKILIEVELDKPFPKLIALHDKQGNIFFVEVEYSWILVLVKGVEHLDTRRRGAYYHLSHKIMLLLQKSIISSEPNSHSPIAQQTHETFKKPLVTLSPKYAFASPVTHSHEVHSDPCSQINHTFPLLAAEKAVPVQSHIMESIPSHSIILEDSETSKIEQPIDSRSSLTLDHHNLHMEDTPFVYGKGNGFDMVGDSSSYTITRGGRTIKPTQKVQDMRWTRASGRGKKGHRGRGNQNH